MMRVLSAEAFSTFVTYGVPVDDLARQILPAGRTLLVGEVSCAVDLQQW